MNSKNIGYMHNASPEILDQYFRLLNQRFLLSTEKEQVYTKFYSIAENIFRVEFSDQEFFKRISTQLSFCEIEKPKDPSNISIVLKIWPDDLEKYIPHKINDAKGLYLWQEDFLALSILYNENRIEAYDRNSSTMFFSASDFSQDSVAKYGHLFVQLFSAALEEKDACLVHAAAIGMQQKGVLIVGKGGAGKSTLAISSLLQGCDYISDDYTVLKQSSKLFAFPIYSIAYLTPQILNHFPALSAKCICMNYNNEKYMVDLSSYHSNFASKMEVKTVIFPELSNIDTPVIEKMNAGTAVTQLVYSTLTQSGNRKNQDKIKKIISFVKDLNFYKIKLSQFPQKNALILNKFIKEEL